MRIRIEAAVVNGSGANALRDTLDQTFLGRPCGSVYCEYVLLGSDGFVLVRNSRASFNHSAGEPGEVDDMNSGDQVVSLSGVAESLGVLEPCGLEEPVKSLLAEAVAYAGA